MPEPLQRKTLAAQLADRLQQELRAGSWGDSLPGHRTLMTRYGVSAKTVIAAVALLEQRGAVLPAEHGRRRRLGVGSMSPAAGIRDLLIMDRLGLPSGADRLLLQAYRDAWERAGGTVHSIQMDFIRCRHPAALLRQAVNNHRTDAILLHMAPRRWTESGVGLRPVFLSGGEYAGLPITGVGFSAAVEIGNCVRRFMELGHRRIAVPHDEPGEETTAAIRRSLGSALGMDPLGREVAALTPVCRQREPGAWALVWQQLLTQVRPTAVVVTDDIHYLSLMGRCHAAGLRIPQDLSVVCLEDTGHLAWCHPRPCQMAFPVRKAVSFLLKWKRSRCRALGMQRLPLIPLPGDTLAPPPIS